jgi:GrpB-like predicted nucleotidyltransferase (UPF0157 family)
LDLSGGRRAPSLFRISYPAARLFRDALRAQPALAAEYARLKVELAQHHRFDREAYTQAKRHFIDRVTEVALERGRVRLRNE